MKLFRSATFESRILFAIAVPMLAALFTIFPYFLYERIDAVSQGLKTAGKRQSQYIASMSEYALLSGDTISLQSMLEHMVAEIPEINSIRILDVDKSDFIAPTLKALPTQLSAGKALTFTAPVEVALLPIATYDLSDDINFTEIESLSQQSQTVEKQVVGYIELNLSTLQADQLRNRIIFIYSCFTFLALAIGYITARLLSGSVVDPISKIIKTISALREGDYSKRIKSKSDDELGELSRNIDQLASQLQKTRERVELQFKQLSDAREKATQASQAKSEFLASMSHELRQPLTAIIGFLPTLKRINKSEYASEVLDIIDTQSNKLCRRIDEILNFEQIEAGKLKFLESYFDIENEIQTITEWHQTRATQKDIKLSYLVDTDERLPDIDVFTDQVHFQTIIDNLIGNALKFTQHGSVFVYIKQKYQTDNELLAIIEIRDTGIGIPEEKLEHIFKPFEQADQSSTRRFQGTGLGLHISKKIVDLLGGEIAVESKAEKGSVFTVKLPLTYRPKANTLKTEDDQSHNINPIVTQVLYVEDNPSSQTVVKYLLEQINVHADIANSANEGLALFRKSSYKMAFIDLHMPGMDGFQLCHEIRKHEMASQAREHATLIALTADATQEAAEKCYACGFDNILNKPFKEIDLFNAVRGILEIEDKLKELNAQHQEP